MKNSVGTAGKRLIMSVSVGVKGQHGGDTTLGRWRYYATKTVILCRGMGIKKNPRAARGRRGLLLSEMDFLSPVQSIIGLGR